MELSNSVFQGTEHGPTLWDVFFSDVSLVPAASMGGQDIMFVDDSNLFKECDQHVSLEQVTEGSQKCCSKVHRWGAIDRVSFGPYQELMIVLHPCRGHGTPLILGPHGGH